MIQSRCLLASMLFLLAFQVDAAPAVTCNRGGVGNEPAARACNEAIGAIMRKHLPGRQVSTRELSGVETETRSK